MTEDTIKIDRPYFISGLSYLSDRITTAYVNHLIIDPNRNMKGNLVGVATGYLEVKGEVPRSFTTTFEGGLQTKLDLEINPYWEIDGLDRGYALTPIERNKDNLIYGALNPADLERFRDGEMSLNELIGIKPQESEEDAGNVTMLGSLTSIIKRRKKK